MRPPARYAPEGAADLAGLKKILRKVAPFAAAAAAVATGQPQLAIPAATAAKAATAKKAKYVEPPAPPVPTGFLDNLVPGDRNALMIGGAVLGTLVLAKVMFRK